MKEPLILLGAGGHSKACIDVIEQEGRFEIVGILDMPEKMGTSILGYPVIGSDDMIPELAKQYRYFFITIGQIGAPGIRKKLYHDIKRYGSILPVITSPNAHVSKYSTAGEGTIIMHHAMVNASAEIGVNCIINSKTLIEHDAQIGDHCHIATGAIINGFAIVGADSFVGSGAVTKQGIVIPGSSFIKACSLVK